MNAPETYPFSHFVYGFFCVVLSLFDFFFSFFL